MSEPIEYVPLGERSLVAIDAMVKTEDADTELFAFLRDLDPDVSQESNVTSHSKNEDKNENENENENALLAHLPDKHDQSSHASKTISGITIANAPQSFDKKDLTEKDYANLESYSGDGFSSDVNPFLRGKSSEYLDLNNKDEVQEMKDVIHSMDRVAASYKTDKNLTTYRTAPFGKLKTGDVVQDDAFMSTTPIRAVAHKYADGGNHMMQISVPKGSQHIPHGDISHSGAKGEVILPRGSRLKVTKILEDGTVLSELLRKEVK